MKQIILNEGTGHLFLGRHNWFQVENDAEELQKLGYENFEALDNYYARYRFLYECSCGAKMMTEEVALI